MTPQIKLLPFIFLMVTACSNEKDTNKKLRDEIEMKDRQRTSLQSEVQRIDADLQNQTSALEALRLSGGPEVVAEATKARDSAIAEKAALEKEIAAKELELKASLAKLDDATRTQLEMEKSAETLSIDIKAKTDEIAKLGQRISKLSPEAEAAEALREQLQAARKDLANLQNAAKTKEEELTKANLVLKDEITAKVAEIGSLNGRITELSAANATAAAVSEVQSKLDTAKKELSDLQVAKNKTDLDLALSKKTISGIMTPVFGMYHSDVQNPSFDGKACRQFVYVEASGRATQAILCDDNRVQWESRDVLEFSAIADRNLVGQVGLQMKTTKTASSCGVNQTVFADAGIYTFEKYLSAQPTAGSGSLQIYMNGGPVNLVSSAEKLYTEDCEGLMKFAENGTVLDSAMLPLLKQAAQMCQLVSGKVSEASLDAGCFTASNIFMK